MGSGSRGSSSGRPGRRRPVLRPARPSRSPRYASVNDDGLLLTGGQRPSGGKRVGTMPNFSSRRLGFDSQTAQITTSHKISATRARFCEILNVLRLKHATLYFKQILDILLNTSAFTVMTWQVQHLHLQPFCNKYAFITQATELQSQ